jgi:hypothetical protein
MTASDPTTSKRKKPASRKHAQGQVKSGYGVAGFIEHQFRRKVWVVENGIKMRRTVLEIIVMQLCRAEADGKPGATRALLRYKELGGDRRRNMKVIVKGGLPQPKRDR